MENCLHPSKVGPFLVLENNPQATDFTADVIKLGKTPQILQLTHGIRDVCLKFTPKKVG